jgi:Fe-S-cluster-containing dehydrogenase component
MMYEFEIRTGKVKIDHTLCETCNEYGCVKACSLYGRNILRIRNGKPVTFLPPEEIKRRDNECLACEFHCPYNAINIELPFPELENYLRRR